MKRRVALPLFLALAAELCVGTALANGRFPRAQRVVEHPTDPNTLFMSATYGVVFTTDGGQTWGHLCENAYAFGLFETDHPLLELLDDGTLLAGTSDSLNALQPGGCEFKAILGGPDNEAVPDLVWEGGLNVLALLLEDADTTSPSLSLQFSSDGGDSWTELNPDLELGSALTLDSEPNDRNRIYVTGLDSTGSGVMLRSSDRGKTFERFPILDTGFSHAPYIAAVHPTQSGLVFVRTDGRIDDRGAPRADDALLVTLDGGETWRELFRASAKLYGFAVSPDGLLINLGYGDPFDETLVNEPSLGVFQINLETLAIEQRYDDPVSCLRWAERGLYACTSRLDTGFELGLSMNPTGVLLGFTPLFDGASLSPVSCYDAVCQPEWEVVCQSLEACDNEPVDPPDIVSVSEGGEGGQGAVGGEGGQATGGTAGAAMGGTGGSTGGNGASAGDDGMGGTAPKGGDDDGDGCGCGVPRSTPMWWGWSVVGLGVLLRRWRRR